MITVRPIQDLAKRAGFKISSVDRTSTAKLGDWYAKGVIIRRKHFVICVSETTRLAVVLDGAPYETFPSRLPDQVAKLLGSYGVSKEKIAEEQDHMSEIFIGKTANRSIVGTLNEYCFLLRVQEEHDPKRFKTNLDRSLSLSKTPSLVMEPGFPEDVVRQIFSRPRLSVVRND